MIFLELAFVFFTIGLFTIGGGYAMIPMINDQVISRGWLTVDELTNFLAIAESTPGPFAVNVATLIGFNQGSQYGVFFGIIGAVVTTTSVVLPSFIIILIIAKFLKNFLEYKWVKYAMDGIKAIIAGLILSVVVGLVFKNVFHDQLTFQQFDYLALLIMVIVFVIKMIYKKTNPILLIILSGILGILFYGLLPMII